MAIDASELLESISCFPRIPIAHTPTPIETLVNLSSDLGLSLHVKRDDLTGVAFGGNKVRQLEFYFGEARVLGADTIVITGAVQSNFARTAAAIAGRLDMECHIQLEDRVPDPSDTYNENGNVLLDRLLGATIHRFPLGEDENAADVSTRAIADDLRASGRIPYVIPLGAEHPPLGSLGYVLAAVELLDQIDVHGPFDQIVIGSGSALSHVGLLFGLRSLGDTTAVHGVCVRRDAAAQWERVRGRLDALAEMLCVAQPVDDADIVTSDGTLSPGYGVMNGPTTEAIRRTSRREGLFLDPTYTGKVMATLIELANGEDLAGDRVLFWHTGGQPALFGYADQLAEVDRG